LHHMPAFKGLEKFKGISCQTAAWPQEGIDIKAKRVGVIGTGSSDSQLIANIAPDVARLTVFQRSPTYALPMRQQKLDPEIQNRSKATYHEVSSSN
jgi:cation diffusion facilitator CzcD-associated flavoprotein CzcO